MQSKPSYRYSAELVRVIDGDTIIFNVDLGFRTSQEITVRLMGIDTPETHRPRNEAERRHGQEAKALVRYLLMEAQVVIIETSKTGKYGRWIADVSFRDPVAGWLNLTEVLIRKSLEKRDYYEPDPMVSEGDE